MGGGIEGSDYTNYCLHPATKIKVTLITKTVKKQIGSNGEPGCGWNLVIKSICWIMITASIKAKMTISNKIWANRRLHFWFTYFNLVHILFSLILKNEYLQIRMRYVHKIPLIIADGIKSGLFCDCFLSPLLFWEWKPRHFLFHRVFPASKPPPPPGSSSFCQVILIVKVTHTRWSFGATLQFLKLSLVGHSLFPLFLLFLR